MSPATSGSAPTQRTSSATSTPSSSSPPSPGARPARRDLSLALIALIPLLVVVLRLSIAQGLIYLYADSGATVSKNSDLDPDRADVRGGHRLLPVTRLPLPGGAQPDRGQARRDGARGQAGGPGDPRQRPDRLARDARPALADDRATSSLGPVAAIGVVSALFAGLTLLPALLTIFGRRGFWPRRAWSTTTLPHAPTSTGAPGAASATACCSGPGWRWRSPPVLFAPGSRPACLQGRLLEHELLQELGRER